MKKNNFIKSILILTIGGIITKILGMVIKIVLTRNIGVEGIDQLLAVSMMGDGMRRFLNIVAAAANPTNNIILIDEIDNGLHYSAYKKLWEAIFALATSTKYINK